MRFFIEKQAVNSNRVYLIFGRKFATIKAEENRGDSYV